jgi:hypothetical protein
MARPFLFGVLLVVATSLNALGNQEKREAEAPTLRLINQTGCTLSDLRISPTGSQDWGPDVLIGEDLEDLSEALVPIPGLGPWDLLVNNGEGDREELTGIPLESEKTWIIVRRFGHLSLERGPPKRRKFQIKNLSRS